MRPPEIFETERLRLRPVRREDTPAIFAEYAGCEAPTRWMDWPRSGDVYETIVHVERGERCWTSPGSTAFPWAVEDGATGAFMGMIELRLHPPKADFGYVFGERFWGRGFATEAARVVADWTMAQPEIWRLWATCAPENVASAKVLEKAGLRKETTLANWTPRPQLGLEAAPADVYARLRGDEVGLTD